ncbi:MAG: GNAT family N-acetyltransferase [Neisseria sp.]|nr:GNAT family N-acetyltransferase [Neisseria sp.]
MKTHPLHSLFNPQHIAVIGASERAGRWGEQVMTALAVSYNGRLTPVSLKHHNFIGSTAAAWLAKLEAEGQPDLAVIACPSEDYETAVKFCLRFRIANALVLFPDEAAEQSFRKQKIGALAQGRLNIVCCTAEGFGIPPLPLHSRFRTVQPLAGKTAFIGRSTGSVDEIIALTAPLGSGLSHYFALSAESPVPSSRLIAYLNEDTQVQTLIVQIAPEEMPAELFAALRLAARRKNIILYGNLHTDPVGQAVLVHVAERCGCLAVFTPDNLRSAVRAAVLPKKHRSNQWHILSNHQQAWLAQQLAADGFTFHRADTLPSENSPQSLAAAARRTLADENCRALLLAMPDADAASLALLGKVQQQADKALCLLTPFAQNNAFSDGLYNFADAAAFRRTLLMQNAWQAAKKVQSQSPRAWQAEAPEPDFAAARKVLRQPEKLAAALALPPLGHSDGLRLQYRVHEHYGCLLLVSGADTLCFLPPFQSSHARRLAEYTGDKKAQAEWESLLRLLNRIRLGFPELQAADFVYRDKQWQTQNLRTDRNGSGHSLLPAATSEAVPFRSKNRRNLTVRPLEAEDAEAVQEFVRNLSDEARKTRFMLAGKELPAALLAQFCQPVHPLETALAAFDKDGTIHGLAQTAAVRFPDECEFGICVSTAMQGQGLAAFMMEKLIAKATRQGYETLSAEILADNLPMKKLAEKLGFTLRPSENDNKLLRADMTLKNDKMPTISEKIPSIAEKIPAILKRQ